MRWRNQVLFVILSLLSLLSAVLAGLHDERSLDLVAVMFAAFGLLSLQPQRSRF